MEKVLLTFAGFNDVKSDSDKLKTSTDGPILGLLKERKKKGEEDFSTVVIFLTADLAEHSEKLYEKLRNFNPNIKIEIIELLEIIDPTDYEIILKTLRAQLKNLENSGIIGQNKEKYILITPGTCQIHASWILLVANEEIKARILNVRAPGHEGPPYSVIDITKPDFPINWAQWRKYAVGTAVSAIISRNFSHHIGSHILPRTGISNIERRLKNLYRSKLKSGQISIIKKRLRESLDHYIQKRGDFNAEIATQPLLSSRYARFFDDVLIGFITNTLIIDNLGANEGMRYNEASNSKIKFNFSFNGIPLKAIFNHSDCPYNHSFSHLNYPYCGCCPDCREELSRTYVENGDLDPVVSLPGMLGEHAFYAFLENFIRNGIKHNRRLIEQNPQINFEVNINVREPEDEELRRDFYLVEIWDNLTNPYFETSRSISEAQTIFDYLKYLLGEPLVTHDGSIRKAGWGLAEMQIMATVLRGLRDFSNMKNNLTVEIKNIDEKPRLIYSFYIMKSKGIAVVTDKIGKSLEKGKDRIIWFSSLHQLKEELKVSNNLISYQFVIIDQTEIDIIKLKEILHLLPARLIISSKKDGMAILSDEFISIPAKKISEILNSDIESIESKIWKLWIEGLLNKKGLDSAGLVLFFQQEKNEEPTKSWIERANMQDNNKLKLAVMYKGEMKNEIAGDFSSNLLVYDRHFGAYSCIPQDRIIFHEAYDKGSADFTMIFQPFRNDKIIFELIESALIKVVLVDERIAEFAHEELKIEDYAENVYGSKKRVDVARGAGILIATYMCLNGKAIPIHKNAEGKSPAVCLKVNKTRQNDHNQDFSIHLCKNLNCSKCRGTEINGIDIIIIHQGLIDNLAFRGFIDKELIHIIGRKIPQIFIDSGRGIPQGLDKNVKFIPYSFLESHVMGEKIAKHRLVNSLMTMTFRAQ